ncbi:MAG: ComF family protein [Paraclostridium sp.]
MDWIYPSNIKCIICDNPISKSNTYSLCKECFIKINFINDGCIKCGKTIRNYILDEIALEEKLNGCKECISKSYYFDKAISCIEYDDVSKIMIFGLKYYNKTYIRDYIVEIMIDKLNIENLNYDYIVYVPLHKKREKKRGFNQSKVIAKTLGRELDIEVLDLVVRSKNTTRLFELDDKSRKQELKNAFELNDQILKCKNKNILVIDDIFTTGSTVNEISKILKVNGVGNIYILTLLTRINCY